MFIATHYCFVIQWEIDCPLRRPHAINIAPFAESPFTPYHNLFGD